MPKNPSSSRKRAASSKKRRPGRPPGSVALTPEIQDVIVSYIAAGAFPHAAAQAAGISPRTFFDWMARGRDEHPTRTATPKLRAFARKVDEARAQARIAAEIRVYREHPKHWLKHAARSRPDSDGWTELKEWTLAHQGPTFEDRLREIDHLEAIEDRDEHRRSCDDPDCSSPWHQGRYDDDDNCTGPFGLRPSD